MRIRFELFNMLFDNSRWYLIVFLSFLMVVHLSVDQILFYLVFGLLSRNVHDYRLNMRFDLVLGVDLRNIHLVFIGVNLSLEVCPTVG